jgi:hypothetical protein
MKNKHKNLLKQAKKLWLAELKKNYPHMTQVERLQFLVDIGLVKNRGAK